MGIDVRWYNDEQTILMVHYPEHWTWEEYAVTFAQAKAMIEAATHGVYTIHYSDSSFYRFPIGRGLLTMRQSVKQRPKNLLKSFLVVPSGMSRSFVEMILKVLPENRRNQPNVFASSVEEALAQIAKLSVR